MYHQKRRAGRTNAHDRPAFEMGVDGRHVKHFSKSTQKGERANIGVCVIEGYSQSFSERRP